MPSKHKFPPFSYLFLLLATIYTAALAQEPASGAETAAENKPTVAVYVTGDIPDYQRDFVGTYLLNALTNNGAEINDENAAAFLTAAGKEQSKRKKAPMDDSLLCELGRKSNVRYILAASITPPTPTGSFTLSGRVISAKTCKSRFHGEATGPIITMGSLAKAAETLLEKMFDGKPIFGGQTAPEPVHTTQAPTPQPELVSTPLNELSPDTAEIAAADTNTAEPVFKSPSARVKYVAVVETEIDAQSGASSELTSADARLVTAELRREAVKNLPKGKYNVMTSETVYAQGSAVLEQCADENCVIVLGSAIGADFIVRGTISKVQTKFTLSVEIYETNDGNLVASSDPIRSESLGELLEQAAAVCADMYKTFVNAHTPPEPVAPPTTPPVIIQEPDSPLWKLRKMGMGISVGIGGTVAAGYGGGIEWNSGERVTMPYSAAGAYLYLDAVYTELFLGYHAGDGTWESPNVPDQDLPNMPRTCINIGVFAKYPFDIATGALKLFLLLGLDYEASISGSIQYSNGNGEYTFDGANNRPGPNTLNSLWLKIGGGIDLALGRILYLRSEIIYGLRAANSFEYYCVEKLPDDGVSAKFGQEVAVKVGVGIKL